MKCLQFLVHVFLDCKLSFRLLWRKYRTVRRMRMRHKACKGHWEFRFTFHSFWQPAQIHIHVQMRLAGTSLCQRCRISDEILSAPNRPYHASVVDEQYSAFVKHWKDCFNSQKQNRYFRITVFQCKIQMFFDIQTWKRNFLCLSQLPVNTTAPQYYANYATTGNSALHPK